jgi:hypothetical protein
MDDREQQASHPPRERALRKRQADEDDLAEVIGGLLESPARHYLGRQVVPYARVCEKPSNSSLADLQLGADPAIVLVAVVPALVVGTVGAGTRSLATGLGIIGAATA